MGRMRSLAFSLAVVSSGKTTIAGPGERSIIWASTLSAASEPPVCGVLHRMTTSTPGKRAASITPTRYGVKTFCHIPGRDDMRTTRYRSTHLLGGSHF